jgi:hypothetical protein
MESKKLKRDLIIIVISTFIVIVCWIGFNIYSIAVTSTIDATLTKQILPIDPSFDTATIDSLAKRKRIAPLYQPDPASLTPTPEATPTPPVVRPTPAGIGPTASGGAIIEP